MNKKKIVYILLLAFAVAIESKISILTPTLFTKMSSQITTPNTETDKSNVHVKFKVTSVDQLVYSDKKDAESYSTTTAKAKILKNTLGVWGVIQVVSVIANAVKRLYPIAIQPIVQKDLLPIHWALYVGWIIYMAYVEGYKAFQLKFAPLVVSRAFSLVDNPSVLNYLLAGPYSMGLFGASRSRMIVSWLITIGVFSLVVIVKMLPYPYRSIVDAGVVVGLSYGTISIVAFTIVALLGGKVAVPEANESSSKKYESSSKKV